MANWWDSLPDAGVAVQEPPAQPGRQQAARQPTQGGNWWDSLPDADPSGAAPQQPAQPQQPAWQPMPGSPLAQAPTRPAIDPSIQMQQPRSPEVVQRELEQMEQQRQQRRPQITNPSIVGQQIARELTTPDVPPPVLPKDEYLPGETYEDRAKRVAMERFRPPSQEELNSRVAKMDERDREYEAWQKNHESVTKPQREAVEQEVVDTFTQFRNEAINGGTLLDRRTGKKADLSKGFGGLDAETANKWRKAYGHAAQIVQDPDAWDAKNPAFMDDYQRVAQAAYKDDPSGRAMLEAAIHDVASHRKTTRRGDGPGMNPLFRFGAAAMAGFQNLKDAPQMQFGSEDFRESYKDAKGLGAAREAMLPHTDPNAPWHQKLLADTGAITGQLAPGTIATMATAGAMGPSAAGATWGSWAATQAATRGPNAVYWWAQTWPDMYVEQRQRGLSDKTAFGYTTVFAPAIAAIELIEMDPTGFLLKEGVGAAAQQGFRARAKEVAKDFAKRWAKETVLEEGSQAAVQEMAFQFGARLSGEAQKFGIEIDPTLVGQAYMKSVEAMKEAAGPIALMGVPGGVGGIRGAAKGARADAQMAFLRAAEKWDTKSKRAIDQAWREVEAEHPGRPDEWVAGEVQRRMLEQQQPNEGWEGNVDPSMLAGRNNQVRLDERAANANLAGMQRQQEQMAEAARQNLEPYDEGPDAVAAGMAQGNVQQQAPGFSDQAAARNEQMRQAASAGVDEDVELAPSRQPEFVRGRPDEVRAYMEHRAEVEGRELNDEEKELLDTLEADFQAPAVRGRRPKELGNRATAGVERLVEEQLNGSEQDAPGAVDVAWQTVQGNWKTDSAADRYARMYAEDRLLTPEMKRAIEGEVLNPGVTRESAEKQFAGKLGENYAKQLLDMRHGKTKKKESVPTQRAEENTAMGGKNTPPPAAAEVNTAMGGKAAPPTIEQPPLPNEPVYQAVTQPKKDKKKVAAVKRLLRDMTPDEVASLQARFGQTPSKDVNRGRSNLLAVRGTELRNAIGEMEIRKEQEAEYRQNTAPQPSTPVYNEAPTPEVKNAQRDEGTAGDEGTAAEARAAVDDARDAGASGARGEGARLPAGRQAKVVGNETSIEAPGYDKPIKATYAVVPLASLQASHDFSTGVSRSNPQYPKGLQPRNYASGSEEAAKVMRMAEEKKAGYYISSHPGADNGPPSITPNGTVLNGNGRVMSLQLSRSDLSWYTDELRSQAASFGIDPASLEGVENPVLVRLVDMDSTSKEAVKFARAGNVTTTQSQSPVRTAAALSEMITDDVLRGLSLNDDTTFSEAVSHPIKGRAFRDDVRRNLPPQQRSQYFAPDGMLTESGKELARNMLMVQVVPVELLEDLSERRKQLKLTLEGSIPQLLKLKRDFPAGDIGPALVEALEFLVNNSSVKSMKAVEDTANQPRLFGEARLSPAGEMMVEFLIEHGDSSRVFRERLGKVAVELGAQFGAQGKAGLFGAQTEERDPVAIVSEGLGVKSRPGAVFGGKAAEPAKPKYDKGGKKVAEQEAPKATEAEEDDGDWLEASRRAKSQAPEPAKFELTTKQKESLASALSTNTLKAAEARIRERTADMGSGTVKAAIEFLRQIDPYYKKRDGFVPREVTDIINKGRSEAPKDESTSRETPAKKAPPRAELIAAVKADLDSWLKKASLPAEHVKHYRTEANRIFDVLPDGALAKLRDGVSEYKFYPNQLDLTRAAAKKNARAKELLAKMEAGDASITVGGFYDKGSRTLHLDWNRANDLKGEQQSSTGDWYAHEMAHAIDGPKYELTKTPEWKAAWESDIKGKGLSNYANKNVQEGFAEFSRLLYGVGTSVETLQAKYPKATAFFEQHGLLPHNGTSTETSVKEVFDEPVVDENVQGDTGTPTTSREEPAKKADALKAVSYSTRKEIEKAKTLRERIGAAAEADRDILDDNYSKAGLLSNEVLRTLDAKFRDYDNARQQGSPTTAERINTSLDMVQQRATKAIEGLRKIGKNAEADFYEQFGLPLIDEARQDLLGQPATSREQAESVSRTVASEAKPEPKKVKVKRVVRDKQGKVSAVVEEERDADDVPVSEEPEPPKPKELDAKEVLAALKGTLTKGRGKKLVKELYTQITGKPSGGVKQDFMVKKLLAAEEASLEEEDGEKRFPVTKALEGMLPEAKRQMAHEEEFASGKKKDVARELVKRQQSKEQAEQLEPDEQAESNFDKARRETRNYIEMLKQDIRPEMSVAERARALKDLGQDLGEMRNSLQAATKPDATGKSRTTDTSLRAFDEVINEPENAALKEYVLKPQPKKKKVNKGGKYEEGTKGIQAMQVENIDLTPKDLLSPSRIVDMLNKEYERATPGVRDAIERVFENNDLEVGKPAPNVEIEDKELKMSQLLENRQYLARELVFAMQDAESIADQKKIAELLRNMGAEQMTNFGATKNFNGLEDHSADAVEPGDAVRVVMPGFRLDNVAVVGGKATGRLKIASNRVEKVSKGERADVPGIQEFNLEDTAVLPTRLDMGDYKGEPISPFAITALMGKLFDVPIRYGNLFVKALGIFKQRQEVVRIAGKYAGHLGVAAHEVSHAIDQKHGISEALKDSTAKAAASDVAKLDYRPGRNQVQEGFAEYMRHRLTRGDAETMAPEFHRWFEGWLELRPDVRTRLDHIQKVIGLWAGQGALNQAQALQMRMGDKVRPEGETNKERWKAEVQTSVYNALTSMKDSLLPIQKFTEAADAAGVKFKGGEAPIELARAFNQGAPASSWRAMERGMHDPVTNQTIGPNLIGKGGVFSDMTFEDRVKLKTYLIALHSREVLDKGIQKVAPMPRDVAEAVIKAYDSEDFRRRQKLFKQYRDAMVRVEESLGLLTAAEADRIINTSEFYVPARRALQADRGGKYSVKFFNIDSQFRKRGEEGSELPIIDILDQTVQDTARLYQNAAQQQVGQAMYDASLKAQGLGWMFETFGPEKFDVADAEKVLKEAGFDTDGLGAEEMVSMGMSLTRSNKPKEHGVVRVKDEHGVKRWMKMEEGLYASLLSMAPSVESNPLEKMLSTAASLQRLGATGANIAFGLKQPIQDSANYFLGVNVPMKEFLGMELPDLPRMMWTPFKLGLMYTKAKMLRQRGASEDIFVQLLRDGGVELAGLLGTDAAKVRRITDEIMHDGETWQWKAPTFNGVMAAFPASIDKMRDLIGGMDMMYRLAQMEFTLESLGYDRKRLEKMREAGEDIPRDVLVQAVNSAKEITIDYSRNGNLGRKMNSWIAFWNAALESKFNLGRKVKQHPMRALTLGLSMAALGVFQWMLRHDDDDYKEREAWEKRHLLLGQKGRLALPREASLLFLLTQVSLDNAYEKDPTSFRAWREEFMQEFLPPHTKIGAEPGYSGVPVPLPSALTPVAEAYMSGYDAFRERDVVPKALQGVKASEQYTEGTSELSKAMGRWFGVSPIRLDHFLNGEAGGMWARTKKGEPFGGVSAFTLRTAEKSIDEFYDAAHKADTAYKTAKLRGQPTPEQVQAQRKFVAYSKVLAAVRKQARGADENARKEATMKLVGIARQALGKEPLKSYQGR